MMLMFCAAEQLQQVAASGGADSVTWAAVGMAAVSNVATWLVIIRSMVRQRKRNGTDTLTREQLARHDADLVSVHRFLEHLVEENREAHRQLCNKLNTLEHILLRIDRRES